MPLQIQHTAQCVCKKPERQGEAMPLDASPACHRQISVLKPRSQSSTTAASKGLMPQQYRASMPHYSSLLLAPSFPVFSILGFFFLQFSFAESLYTHSPEIHLTNTFPCILVTDGGLDPSNDSSAQWTPAECFWIDSTIHALKSRDMFHYLAEPWPKAIHLTLGLFCFINSIINFLLLLFVCKI